MTLNEFHNRLSEIMYIEDRNMVNIVLASIVTNSLRIGDPVWLTLIGPSSGGKSQIIRPFAMAHKEYIHRVDDLTSNTLLSGSLGLEGSLLGRIGNSGIISMDDLTVLFSKSSDERADLLSQFRMVYDGRFSKSSGNRAEPIVWPESGTGYIGMIAGSTPSIYRFFSEVSDMGERFISYRMKPIDVTKALQFVVEKKSTAREMNEEIAGLLKEYLPPLLQKAKKYPLHEDTQEIIRNASQHCTLLRTPLHLDDKSGMVDEFPEPEMPFRVMKQLNCLAQGLQMLQEDPTEKLSDEMHKALEWVAYSLADDKRRAYVRAVAALEQNGQKVTDRSISATTGMNDNVVTKGMSQLQALGLVKLTSEPGTLREYKTNNHGLFRLVKKLEADKMNDYVVPEEQE